MFDKVKAYMEEYQMVNENDTIVAGVSGGADSVCLFLLLEEYCKQKNAKLVAVHLNHKIREEAWKDAEYVKELCEEFGVPLHLFEEDVEKSINMGMNAHIAKPFEPVILFDTLLSFFPG